ncbi:RsmE family RNA methyltransferase [Candidatus Palauibacter sp.]|uniref:RsmE family RNA methyltransferase n=1 Tax=Candidatus Palauibacter sp. TaxID=3101350 RepID=UPI003AF20B90
MSDPGDGRSPQPRPLPTFLADGLAGRKSAVQADLAVDEVTHVRAARIRPGDRLAVADGAGRRWEGELIELGRRGARCRLLRALPARPPLPVCVWAPVANRDRSLWLVEKVVEFGVSEVTWIEWERSRSVGDAGRSESFRQRAARRARAALKQSGGSWLPRLLGPVSLKQALAGHEGAGWLADRGGSPFFAGGTALEVAPVRSGSLLAVAVGPEGGLTAEERRRCEAAGFELISLGPGTLRFETAAVAAVALAAAVIRDTEGMT